MGSRRRRGVCAMIGSRIGLLVICSPSRLRLLPVFCGRLF
nr:MAG TPA: hypothetical protein [Caudoviricetes sp.]